MRYLLLVFILSHQFVFAQEGYVHTSGWSESYHKFEEGEAAYLLADNVNVRDQASSKGKIIDNLPIGTPIKIIEKDKERLRLKGFKTNWYKVSFNGKKGSMTGYVWGGLIADGAIKSANDPATIFMYGVASSKKENNGEYSMDVIQIQIRACKNNKELSKVELEASAGTMAIHNIQNFGNKGVNGIEDIIEFGESQQSCGGINAYAVLFWDGKTLFHIKTRKPAGDAPYYFSDDLIFPLDEGGVKGKIISEQQEGWYDDEKEQDMIDSHKKIEYVWTGKLLKKTKVLLDEHQD